ncbi:hypothetical protein [Streptomyces decoyicus]
MQLLTSKTLLLSSTWESATTETRTTDVQYSERYVLKSTHASGETGAEEFETYEDAKDKWDLLLKSRNYRRGEIERVSFVSLATFVQAVS